jgi:hypothetical protein
MSTSNRLATAKAVVLCLLSGLASWLLFRLSSNGFVVAVALLLTFPPLFLIFTLAVYLPMGLVYGKLFRAPNTLAERKAAGRNYIKYKDFALLSKDEKVFVLSKHGEQWDRRIEEKNGVIPFSIES